MEGSKTSNINLEFLLKKQFQEEALLKLKELSDQKKK